MGSHGITDDSTVVLYGDNSNWFAAYTYWQFKYYGHDDVTLMDGGRDYWFDNDYPTTDDVPEFSAVEYNASGPCVVHPRVPRGCRERYRLRSPTCRRPFARGVLRRDPRPAWTTGDRSARRPHPWRTEYLVGSSHQRRRHLQEPRRD